MCYLPSTMKKTTAERLLELVPQLLLLEGIPEERATREELFELLLVLESFAREELRKK